MMNSFTRCFLISGMALSLCTATNSEVLADNGLKSQPKFSLESFFAVNNVAEIIVPSPDGEMLFFTDSAGFVGAVDINDPSKPKMLANQNVQQGGVGEPTSLDLTQDGKFLVVAVRLGDNQDMPNTGVLRIYAIGEKGTLTHVKDKGIGIGPDSIALAGVGKDLQAVIAIEDEETNADGDALLPGKRPGAIEIVFLGDLYGANEEPMQRIELVQALASLEGVQFVQDPQPEFVSISPDQSKAAVTLQENNAIAIVDISQKGKAQLLKVFSAGTVQRVRSADIQSDKEISLKESFEGRREPDAVTFITNTTIATANEGDTKKTKDGIMPGSRSFTIFDIDGNLIFENMDQGEKLAVQFGYYPDSRSKSKGIEPEGITFGKFGEDNYLAVASERGSFLEIYKVNDPKKPEFVQLLPTGIGPEGVTTALARKDQTQLLITSNETDGSITIYSFHNEGTKPNPKEPRIVSTGSSMPWGALSGLTSDADFLYSLPDNAFAQSRIFRLNKQMLEEGFMQIDKVIPLSQKDGSAYKVDPEGIAKVADGFWVALEGKTPAENALVKIDNQGTVQEEIKLSAEILALFANQEVSTGFEGVAISHDGNKLYVPLQRGFDPKKPQAAILTYEISSKTWISSHYPLDQHSKNPEKIWTGLSGVTLDTNGDLFIIERDKGGEKAKTKTVEIKRIYKVKAVDLLDGATVSKQLAVDLVKDHNFLLEKVEGITFWNDELWIVNDNDGAGWTRILNLGKVM